MYYCRGIVVYEEDDIVEAIDNLYGDFAPPIVKNIMIHKAKINKNLMKYFVNISNMSTLFEFMEEHCILDTIVAYLRSKYKDDTIYKIENAFMVPSIDSIIYADEEDIDAIIEIASVQKVIYIEASSNELLEKMKEFSGTEANRMSIKLMPYYEPYNFMEVIDKIFKIF